MSAGNWNAELLVHRGATIWRIPIPGTSYESDRIMNQEQEYEYDQEAIYCSRVLLVLVASWDHYSYEYSIVQ
eukprot:scaffold546783_cov26-Prasinocladus_malaysianus.AAC.1